MIQIQNVTVSFQLKEKELEEVLKENNVLKLSLSKWEIEQSMLNTSLDKIEKDLEKVTLEAAKYKSFLSL